MFRTIFFEQDRAFVEPIEAAAMSAALSRGLMDMLKPASAVSDAITRMPDLQLLGVIAICGFFVLGIYFVLSLHYRRIGKVRPRFATSGFPFAELNCKEWLLAAAVLLISSCAGLLLANAR
jgi:hypothetical protein